MEQQNQNDEIEIDLMELFYVLLDKIWIILATTVAGAVLALVITQAFITPLYSSSSMIYIKNGGSSSLATMSMADLQVSSELTSDYNVLVTSRPVVNKVIKNLDLDLDYKEFLETVSTENPTDTRFLRITVTNPDPYMAKTIVDELTDATIERTAEIMDTDKPSMAEEGTVAEEPDSPSIVKNTAIGAILGFLLAAGLFVVLYLLDDSIKTEDDVEKYLGLNTLGTIPMEEGKSKKEEMKKRKRKNSPLKQLKNKKKGAA